MLAAITGGIMKFQSLNFSRFATLKAKRSPSARTQENVEECLVKEKLSKISLFVEQLVSSGVRMVPYVDYLPKVYHELATVEVSKEQGRVSGANSANGGMYMLAMDADDILFTGLREADVSIVELDKEGRAMFRKKLVYAAERVVISCHSCYHLADVQYLMYLAEHIDALPRVMKNGKGNIFAGTTITVDGESYVPMATFLKGEFHIELISLTSELADVAQFVIIERNR